jgi:hypothetical protein
MSTKISKKRFIEILKKLIRQEIAEVSTTGTAGTYPGGPGHYYTPHAFSSGSVGSKNPEVGGYKKVNEVKFAVTIDMGKLGQGKVLVDAGSKGMAKTMVAKKLKQGLKGVISVSRVQPSLGKQVDRKIENVNEVTKQEVNALRNLVKGIGNLKKDFSKATYIGDKELRKKDYNKHYETLLKAEKAMVELMQIFKNKQMLGEGRYHEWRNDESLTPRQKIGHSIREVRHSLSELDSVVKMAVKLKTELNMDSRSYWKNTHKALTKISERLVKMANKVGNLK